MYTLYYLEDECCPANWYEEDELYDFFQRKPQIQNFYDYIYNNYTVETLFKDLIASWTDTIDDYIWDSENGLYHNFIEYVKENPEKYNIKTKVEYEENEQMSFFEQNKTLSTDRGERKNKMKTVMDKFSEYIENTYNVTWKQIKANADREQLTAVISMEIIAGMIPADTVNGQAVLGMLEGLLERTMETLSTK